jgi:small nuclear ribonucleoprotein (snRNP)-like protein
LKKTSKHLNIPLTLVFDHLYGKTRSKKTKLVGVLIAKENQVVVFWVLTM